MKLTKKGQEIAAAIQADQAKTKALAAQTPRRFCDIGELFKENLSPEALKNLKAMSC